MKKFTTLFLVFLFVISCKNDSEEKKEESFNTYSINQFFKNIDIGGGTFSEDESKLLYTSNESGIFNLYEITLSSGEKEQLTDSKIDSYFSESYVPGTNQIIYSADQGGNENYKLYLLEDDGSSSVLTPKDSVANQFLGWSENDEFMYIRSNRRDLRFFDLYKMQIDTAKQTKMEMLYENTEGLDPNAMSQDEKYIALVQMLTSANGKMYLFNTETGETEDISVHEGDALYEPEFFSKDSKSLFYLTDENSDFVYLAKRDLETGAVEKLYETNWDVWYAYDSEKGKYRVIGINEDAKTKVIILDNETGKEVKLPKIEGGSISSVEISESEKLIRLTVSTSATPSNLFVYNFETEELKQLTNTLNPEIDKADLVEGQVVRYTSFDGLEIPAIYYQPKTASEENKVPALVWVHGGPGGQSRLSYFTLIQYLVNHGYAILAVNNRGSGGYGKEFNHLDDQKHGSEDLQDCIKGKDFLIDTGVIDEDKIGILGGSYGGFMTMAAMTSAPDEFKVGVNLFGVTNWLRTLNSIPPYWEAFRKALYDEMGDPTTKDSVRLYEISPLFHADEIKNPVMVLQGLNDVRVIPEESDEIVAEIKKNEVPVEYVVFDDEGHGFMKKENEIEGYGKIKTFLDKYLMEVKEVKD